MPATSRSGGVTEDYSEGVAAPVRSGLTPSGHCCVTLSHHERLCGKDTVKRAFAARSNLAGVAA